MIIIQTFYAIQAKMVGLLPVFKQLSTTIIKKKLLKQLLSSIKMRGKASRVSEV